MKNKIEDVRNILMAQLEKMSDEDCNIEKETQRATTMISIAATLIDSARAETEFLKVANTDGQGSGFFPTHNEGKTLPPATEDVLNKLEKP